MAKRKGQTEKKNTGRFQWFLFIVIPVVFTLTVTLIVLNFAGVDVLGTAKKAASDIPVVSSLLNEEAETDPQTAKKMTLLQDELEAKNEEINHLTEQNEMNERTIEGLNQDIVKLKNRIDQESAGNEEEEENQVKNISRSFNEMDAEAAAAIIENMEQEMALAILGYIPVKERGAVLEAMEPVKAAELTSAFLNTSVGQ